MTKEQAEKKLKALKVLAERGVGGERETAKRLYKKLKKKYEIEEDLIKEEADSRFGISIYMGVMGLALQQELEACRECPYQNGEEICQQCGTYENIKDICVYMEYGR